MAKGSNVYLTQKEMSFILEAIDMMELDYGLENLDKRLMKNVEEKIFKVRVIDQEKTAPLKNRNE